MTWQQFLTEKVLKECGHDKTKDRTFDNRNDMMDLYEAIYKIGPKEWELFINFVFEKQGLVVTPVLFCLSGDGYADRCKMVAEFYGWEEKK